MPVGVPVARARLPVALCAVVVLGPRPDPDAYSISSSASAGCARQVVGNSGRGCPVRTPAWTWTQKRAKAARQPGVRAGRCV
ncbi:hypothetical protein C8J57DRAFT_1373974 [Mycena rebaudengoi]|nr:hypothetical protein C8J57DRAFT_1373974 [Mycena rebaudengoi]